MYEGFLLFSVAAALFSIIFVSEVTSGVYILGWAVLLGVYGRLAQAGSQHKALMKVIDKDDAGGEVE